MPPRDGQATRQRILDAATAEFAEYGLAGARVERIAKRAEANPKMLYTYFGGKDELFDRVVDNTIDHAHENVPLTRGDLAGYAGALFDYMVDHPELILIDSWRRLQRTGYTDAEHGHYAEKIDALMEVAPTLGPDGEYDPVDILVLVLAISGMWFIAPDAITARSPRNLASRRAMVVDTVTNLVKRRP
ncbi:MAG: TetR family transcriptional regulator [Actinomycetota bacterium]